MSTVIVDFTIVVDGSAHARVRITDPDVVGIVYLDKVKGAWQPSGKSVEDWMSPSLHSLCERDDWSDLYRAIRRAAIAALV